MRYFRGRYFRAWYFGAALFGAGQVLGGTPWPPSGAQRGRGSATRRIQERIVAERRLRDDDEAIALLLLSD